MYKDSFKLITSMLDKNKGRHMDQHNFFNKILEYATQLDMMSNLNMDYYRPLEVKLFFPYMANIEMDKDLVNLHLPCLFPI